MEAPVNSRIYFSSSGQLSFELFFNEIVEIEGVPRIALEFTDTSKKIYAQYHSGSGSSRLLFTYNIEFGDFGHITYTNQIDLNGGRIVSEDGESELASLTLPIKDLAKFVLWPCREAGYTFIHGNSTTHPKPFCVSMVEMRNDRGVASASLYTQPPWINISRNNARAKCKAVGAGYDLIDRAQWNTLVQYIEGDIYNWASNTIDSSGGISRGHSDGLPKQALSIQGSDPCNGTGQNCSYYSNWNSQKRLLVFEGIGRKTWHVWDLAGNVAEWIRDKVSGHAVLKGNNWNGKANSDLYWENSNMPLDEGYYYAGFRCTYMP